MNLLRKLWFWILLKNPTGLACLLTAWGIGILYVAIALTGLMPGLNSPLAVKFCGIAGVVVFAVMPLLIRVFRA